MIIAIDFDGCICADGFWPRVPPSPKWNARETILALKRLKHYIIINTCRCGVPLENAVNFLDKQGIPYDDINNNNPEAVDKYLANPRKIHADIYIDDKDVFAPRPFSWYKMLDKITLIEESP